MNGPSPERHDPIGRVYGLLLRFYPADFRRGYRERLLQVFDERRRERRCAGTGGAASDSCRSSCGIS
ncbi:MAG TPA: hypothetical protein VK849_08365 [Longimicrobiales bacterium]|nr:hypothetical protein [Longimicrobiales bacterium]